MIALSRLLKKNDLNKTIKNFEINEATSENITKKRPKRRRVYYYRKRKKKGNKNETSININKSDDSIQKSEINLTNKTEGKGKRRKRYVRYIKRKPKKANKEIENDFFLRYIKEIESKNKEFGKHNITTKIVNETINEIKSKENNIYKLTKSDLKSNTLKKIYTKKDIINYIANSKKNPLTLENMKSFNMSENPKISVIVPICNSYKYLKMVHKSIQDQSFKDIEIIYIDDGSKDGSVEFLEKMQEKDKRIIILKNKESKGPFYNRHKGAIFARGEYLQYVDSDDMLVGDILEKAYVTAKKENVDIVQYIILKEFKGRKYYIFNETTNFSIIRQPELSDQMFYGFSYLRRVNNYMFNKIIRREKFLKALIYIGDELLKEDLYYQEDYLQFFSLLRASDSLLFINHFGYAKIRYRDRKSLMSNFHNPKRINKIFHDNFTELKLIYQKTKDNVHDKGVCYDYFLNIRNFYRTVTRYITQGYELFDEVFDLLLKSPYFSDKRKKEFFDFRKKMYVRRKNK